jgi:hypothetical protein
MFDFNNVKETNKLKFVGYGINEPVVVSDVTSGENQNGTPFIQINVKFKDDVDTNSTTLKLYMSQGALDISMRKIMHMHQALNKKELLTNLNAKSLDDLAGSLKAMWINKEFRLKLAGKEYIGVDKTSGEPKTKVRLDIPFPPFAEALTKNAEYAHAEKTALKFDKADKYDYKTLSPSEIAQFSAPKPGNTQDEDSIPF